MTRKIALAILIFSLLPLHTAIADDVKVGERAPDFALRDSKNKKITLSKLAYPEKEKAYRKKRAVLLDFFRTDCAPCKKELPQVISFSKKHGEQVEVIIVALLEKTNGQQKLAAFLQENPVPFTVIVDRFEQAAKKYIFDGKHMVLPGIFLIDKNGTVRMRIKGLEEDLEKALGPAMKEHILVE